MEATWTIVLSEPLEEDDKLELLAMLEGDSTELQEGDKTFTGVTREDAMTIEAFCSEHQLEFEKNEEGG